MKKILKVLGIVVVLLIAAIIIFPIIFKDDIIKMVKDEANNNLNAKVDFGDFDLGIISSFPDFKFTINNVVVDGVGKFEGTRLAGIGTFETTLDLMSVINGEQIKVKSFQIIDLEANAIVLKDSTANWDIVKSTGQEEVAEEVPDTAAPAKFSMALQYYAIKNANIIYDDRPGDMYAEIKNFNHEGNGDFTQDIFLLNTLTSIEEITYKMEGLAYLNKANIEMKFDLEMDMPNSKYTFKDNIFRINALELGFDGWVAMPTDDIEMDLAFNTNKPDFKSILSLVPAVYLTDFADVQTQGKLAFSGMAKGIYNDKNLPAFDVSLLVEDAMFKYPDLPKSVDNIQIKMRASNPGGSDDNTIVDISKFHLEMGDNPVDIRLFVKTPVSDPDMEATLKAQINLASMKEFIPMEEGEDYNGNITADIEMKGKMSTLDSEDYENFEARGSLIILDMNYKSANLPYTVDLKKLYMDFSPRFIELTSFESQVGKSDFAGSGRIDNFLAYTFRDEPLSGSLNIKSNLINVDQFMEEDEAAAESPETTETTSSEASDTSAEGVLEVPANINFVMTMEVNKMLYDNMVMENVKGGVSIKDQQIWLDQFFMNMLDGSILMNGKYDGRAELPQIDFKYDIKKIDLPKTFATFNTVKKLAPIAENAVGAISTNLELKCQLDNKMEVVMNSLEGGGVLHTHGVKIESSETLAKLADALKQPQYKTMELNDNKIFFEFKDGRMYLQEFDLKIANSKAKVSGSQGFDQTLAYKMAMDIPTAEFGSQANEAVNSLLAQGSQYGINAKMPERINVDVLIGGTVEDPKVSVGGMGSSAKPTMEDVKEQVMEEVKEVVKEKVEEVMEDTKEKAREEADKLMKEAEKQAANIKKQAEIAAEQVKKEGYKQADDVEKQAKNPLEKATAKIAAEKLRKETDKKAQQLIDEGDKEAKKVLDTAKKEADEMLK